MLSSHQPIFLCNEKSISDQGDQMDTPLLTIPTIVTILDIAIAGIGSGSDPLTAPTIETIISTEASDHERSERSSYFSGCTAVQVHFMLILISRQKIRS